MHKPLVLHLTSLQLIWPLDHSIKTEGIPDKKNNITKTSNHHYPQKLKCDPNIDKKEYKADKLKTMILNEKLDEIALEL